jgi:hypothetical protein
MNRLTLPGLVALLGIVGSVQVVGQEKAADRSELAAPFAVAADGALIDAPLDEHGFLPGDVLGDNANPWFADFDGDGTPDLLVGQGAFSSAFPDGGRLRIYKNLGAKGRPRFDAPFWFDDLVPTGRIPTG